MKCPRKDEEEGKEKEPMRVCCSWINDKTRKAGRSHGTDTAYTANTLQEMSFHNLYADSNGYCGERNPPLLSKLLQKSPRMVSRELKRGMVGYVISDIPLVPESVLNRFSMGELRRKYLSVLPVFVSVALEKHTEATGC